jgi:glycosyltransferase involved in cell wall biosynthesis
MTKSILYEADNLTLAQGTGIATYASNLAETARKLGYEPMALLGSRRPMSRRDPVLSEISFYDAAAGERRTLAQQVDLARHFLVGSPLGIKPLPLPRTGAVIAPSTRSLGKFGNVFTVPLLVEKAGLHFRRYGAPATVRPPAKTDLFHATQAVPLRVNGVPNVYTVHDLVPLRLPYATLDQKKFTLGVLRDIARRADHIVTVSEHSRRDIVSLLGVDGARVTNTYQSVSMPPEMTQKSDAEVAREMANQFGLDYRGYFLFVGALEPKKNVGRLIDAFGAAGSARPLIIVGSDGWGSERELARLSDEQFLRYTLVDGIIAASRKVRRIPYAAFNTLVSLIRCARALIFPSLYEGFGLPVLEAMSLGTPVITSNVSSLPEIAGDAALLVAPTDVDAIAAAIRTLDADDDLCADLAARGRRQAGLFSPEAYARRLADLYRRLT